MTRLSSFYKRHEKWIWRGAMAAAYLVLFLLHAKIRPYADDIWYIEKLEAWDNFFSLQVHYYLTWSGRVVASALSFFMLGHAFWLWKLLNPLVLLLLCRGMVRLCTPKPDAKKTLIALVLLLLAGPGILDYAVFWATGSFYYLWAAAGAVYLLVPFFDLALRRNPAIRCYPGVLLLAALACLCNEQITALVLGFMVVIIGHALLRDRRLYPKHLVLLLLSGLAALLLFASPGSQERYLQESYLYYLEFYTGFYEVPLAEKILNGLSWMFDMLVNTLYLPLAGLYAYTLFGPRGGTPPAKAKAATMGWWGRALVLGGAVAFCFPVPVDAMLAFAPLSTLFSGGVLAGLAGLLPYAFWGLFLGVLAWMLFRQNGYYGIALLAALCTLAVMFFSPTIYVSGERTLFAAAIILACLILAQLGHKIPPVPAAFVLLLAGVNTLRLASRLQLFH